MGAKQTLLCCLALSACTARSGFALLEGDPTAPSTNDEPASSTTCAGPACLPCEERAETCDGVDNNCDGLVNEGCTLDCRSLLALGDDFDDGVRGDAWGWSANQAGGAHSETGGRLHLTTGMAPTSATSYSANGLFSLSEGHALVEVPTASLQPSARLRFRVGQVGASNLRRFAIDLTNDTLYARTTLDDAVIEETALPYDPVAHRWWRIRGSGTSVLWETSPDGVTFTAVASRAAVAPMTYLQVVLELVNQSATAGPSNAELDNFNGGGSGTTPQCPTQALADAFDEDTLSAAWAPSWTQPGSSLTQAGGNLTLGVPSNQTGYAQLLSANVYDLTDGGSSVRVLALPGGTSQTMLYLADGNNSLRMMAQSGTLRFMVETGGLIATLGSRPYSLAAQPYWRIRATDTTVYWETSPDGITFTAEATSPLPFEVTRMQQSLMAGAWEPVPSPGAAVFDDFNRLP